MPNYKSVDNFDGNKLKVIIEKKNIARKSLAEELGLSVGQIDRYIEGYRKPSVPVFNLMTFILECEKDELLIEEPKKVSNQTSQVGMVIDNHEINQKLDDLIRRVENTDRDLARLSAVIMDIQRTTKEDKANGELLKEDVHACFEKLSNVSSLMGRLHGMLKAMRE